jgi:hypothetical protein
MPIKKFVKEHTNLINVLERGKKSDLHNEAKEQSDELADVLKGSGMWDFVKDAFLRARLRMRLRIQILYSVREYPM